MAWFSRHPPSVSTLPGQAHFKRKPPAPPQSVSTEMSAVMFGDAPWDVWCKADAPADEPWATFIAARTAFEARDFAAAKTHLLRILDQPGLESRNYLQAWHFLRALGVAPESDPKHLYGVVLEAGVNGGLDVIGAYEDHSARYWNFGGAGVVWDRPDDSLDADIDALFAVARTTLQQIGPWEGARLGPPGQGVIRISFLTPRGLHFGQGEAAIFQRDPLAGPIIHRGVILMQKLMALSRKPSSP